MVKRQHRVTSIALTMLLVLGMLMVGAVNVSTTAKAAGGDEAGGHHTVMYGTTARGKQRSGPGSRWKKWPGRKTYMHIRCPVTRQM